MEKPITRSKQFEKNFRKRIGQNKKLRRAFEIRLQLFVDGERGVPLNDHSLTGQMSGRRAFSITGDVRVIYIEEDDCYRFVDIGTHTQVYGQ